MKYTTEDAMNLEEFKRTEEYMRELQAREEYKKEQRMFRIMEVIIYVLAIILFMVILYLGGR